jgi:DHA1 family multidrug resistance protein-like MFS transporter
MHNFVSSEVKIVNLAGIRTSLGLERNIVVLGITSAIGTFGNTLWWFFLPLLLQSQGLSAYQMGMVYSAATLVGAFLQIPSGTLVDRFGRKIMIVLGGLISALSVLLLAIAPNPTWAALAVVSFSGVGPISEPARMALITESVPAEKLATSFGSWKTMAGSIAIAAPLIGGFVVSNRGFREILLISSGLLFLVPILRATFLRETFRPVSASEREGKDGIKVEGFSTALRALLTDRALLMFALAFGIYNLLLFQSSFVVPLYSRSVLAMSPVEIGLMFSVFVFLDAVLAVFFGKLADHFGKIRIIVVSWLGEMVWMMIFAYSGGPSLALISFAFWVAFGSLDGPALQALLGKLTKVERRGLSLGFLNTFSLVLVIPAELITGTLYSISEKLPFFANLGVDFLAFAFFLWFLKLYSSKLQVSG